jgi:hypothetical protein
MFYYQAVLFTQDSDTQKTCLTDESQVTVQAGFLDCGRMLSCDQVF